MFLLDRPKLGERALSGHVSGTHYQRPLLQAQRFKRFFNQLTNQSVNQPINQSINLLLKTHLFSLALMLVLSII